MCLEGNWGTLIQVSANSWEGFLNDLIQERVSKCVSVRVRV